MFLVVVGSCDGCHCCGMTWDVFVTEKDSPNYVTTMFGQLICLVWVCKSMKPWSKSEGGSQFCSWSWCQAVMAALAVA